VTFDPYAAKHRLTQTLCEHEDRFAGATGNECDYCIVDALQAAYDAGRREATNSKPGQEERRPDG
jgi:hypothetical protein